MPQFANADHILKARAMGRAAYRNHRVTLAMADPDLTAWITKQGFGYAAQQRLAQAWREGWQMERHGKVDPGSPVYDPAVSGEVIEVTGRIVQESTEEGA